MGRVAQLLKVKTPRISPWGQSKIRLEKFRDARGLANAGSRRSKLLSATRTRVRKI